MKGRWSDVQGLLSEDNPPGDSNGERACHTEGNSALSLLGTEELTVGVPEDPCMVYYKWSALGISGHMQGLKTPLHRGCGPHAGGGDKSLPAGVGPKKKTSKLRKHLFERRFDNVCAANAHNTIKNRYLPPAYIRLMPSRY